ATHGRLRGRAHLPDLRARAGPAVRAGSVRGRRWQRVLRDRVLVQGDRAGRRVVSFAFVTLWLIVGMVAVIAVGFLSGPGAMAAFTLGGLWVLVYGLHVTKPVEQ